MGIQLPIFLPVMISGLIFWGTGWHGYVRVSRFSSMTRISPVLKNKMGSNGIFFREGCLFWVCVVGHELPWAAEYESLIFEGRDSAARSLTISYRYNRKWAQSIWQTKTSESVWCWFQDGDLWKQFSTYPHYVRPWLPHPQLQLFLDSPVFYRGQIVFQSKANQCGGEAITTGQRKIISTFSSMTKQARSAARSIIIDTTSWTYFSRLEAVLVSVCPQSLFQSRCKIFCLGVDLSRALS